MVNDPIGDLLTRIRNGQAARLTSIKCPASKQRVNLLEVLKGEGYIRGYTASTLANGLDELIIELKYSEGQPAIREISRVSKPGRRVYSKIKDVPRVYNGLGISILSTPRGMLSDRAAREANVGGEILCRVF
jgi:small subunit ribosomal protein S8